MEKKYEIINSNNYILFKFFGEIDDSVCPNYRTIITDIIKKNKTKDLIFDFKHVTFIDSSGIGLILGRYNQIKSNRKKIFVINTSDQIKKLFKISGIYTIINELDITKAGVLQ